MKSMGHSPSGRATVDWSYNNATGNVSSFNRHTTCVHTSGRNGNLKSRDYTHLPESWPAPSTTTSLQSLTGHHGRGLSANLGSKSNSMQEDGCHGGTGNCLDTEDDELEQRGELPAHLWPPYQSLSSMPFQHPLPENSSLHPRYQQERFPIIPPTNPWEFYQQRKEMIARHHWKLSNQDMTFSNAHRCTRMLMKHHWKLNKFMVTLEQEGQIEQQLLNRLIKDHSVLLGTSKFVLAYFQLIRMPVLRP